MSITKRIRLVIDADVLFSYARNGKLYRLLDAIVTYRLDVIVNIQLLHEFYKTCHKPQALKTVSSPDTHLNFITSITNIAEVTHTYMLCPDPDDNYLIDICLQYNAILITDEKTLLNWKKPPIKIKSTKWFKETFPVPL